MIDFLRALMGKIKLEPVAVAGALLAGATILKDQLDGGATIETALTAAVIGLGTYLVRNNVWPAVKVDAATGAAKVQLDDPITGVDE